MYRSMLAIVAGLVFANLAFAGPPRHEETKVVIVNDDGAGETRIELDSQAMGFDLHGMQVGENRSVVDKQGRNVLITREENGFRFDVDGESVTMPLLNESHGNTVWVRKSADGTDDVDVHVVREMHGGPRRMHDGPRRPMKGTRIISEQPIDAATQAEIEALLESAGHSGEVRFIDRSTHDGKIVRIK